MSRKIIGVTVGTQLPKPNFEQTDPTKGDYIKNKPDFEGLKTKVETVSDLVGDTAVSTQISSAVNTHENKPIHITEDERAKWDEAYEYAQGDHAPSDAEKNQNAFGQIIVNNSVFSANNIESSIVFTNTSGITINAKVDTIDGKEVTNVEFDNSGVRSVETGSANGTISVNTGGKVSDVSVKGLGSAAYTDSSAYDAAGAASTALENAKSYVDERLLGFGGTGGGAIPDWNQNNPAAADYIKNRPFYTGSVEKEIYDVNAELEAVSGSLYSMQVSDTEYLHSINTTDLDYAVNLVDLVVGKQYVVIVDGNRYEYTAKSMVMPESYNGAICTYIGEGEEFIAQDIANFTIGVTNVVYPNGYSLATIGYKTTSATPPASFKVYAVEEEVKGIDVKYLPEGGFGYSIQKEVKPIFDGNLDGKEYVELNGIALVKVSDYILAEEECIGAELTIVSGEQSGKEPITANGVIDVSDNWGISCYAVMPDNYIQYGIPFVGVLRESGVVNGISVSAGTYYLYDASVPMYVSYFSAFDEATKEIVMQIDPKYYERLAWVEKGSTSNVWEFNGNLDSVEHYQVDEGQYYVRVLDTYLESEFFVGATCEVNFGGRIESGTFTEDMIEDISAQTGFPAYSIQNQMGLVLSQEYNGMPEGFYVFYIQDEMFVQKITFTQDVFSEPDIIHKIDPKFLPDNIGGGEIPDWNQNDPNGIGYIKNRTHWEEEVDNVVVIVDNFTKSEYDDDNNDNKPKLTFVVGEKYNVIWNGASYNDLVCELDGEYRILGGEGFPFYIYDDGGDRFYVNANDNSDWTVSITQGQGKKTVIHKIDPKFLPDGICNPVSWNNLEDRPFYDNIEKGDEIFSISEEFSGEFFSQNIQVDNFEIENEKTYLVDYDGTTYECIAYNIAVNNNGSVSQLPVIGNAELVHMNGGNNEPFFIGSQAVNELAIFTSTEGTHDIALYTSVGSVKKIDKKYLPDDINNWNSLKDKPFYDNRTKLFEATFDILETYELSLIGNAEYGISYFQTSTVELIDGKKYYVEFDDVLYECTANRYGGAGNGPYVGNIEFFSNRDLSDLDIDTGNDEPFLFCNNYLNSDGVSAIVAEIGRHSISIYEIDENKGFVRNDIYSVSHEFTSDPIITQGIELVENNTYFVEYDGTTYECVARVLELSEGTVTVKYTYIGYTDKLSAPVESDNYEPFFIYLALANDSESGEGVVSNGIMTETEGLHNISIYTFEPVGVLKKLDSKYLPKVNWDNVSNKPFDYTEGESILKQTPTIVEPKKYGDNIRCYVEVTDTFDKLPTKDTWYKVTFRGIEYFCQCRYEPSLLGFDTIYLGNIFMREYNKSIDSNKTEEDTIDHLNSFGVYNTKEPFCIVIEFSEDGSYYAVLDTVSGDKSKIRINEITINHIPDRFISDSAFNNYLTDYNHYYYANMPIMFSDYSQYVIPLGISNSNLKILQITNKVPSREFFIGKTLSTDLIARTELLTGASEVTQTAIIRENLLFNITDVITNTDDDFTADEIAAFGDSYLISKYFLVITQDVIVEEKGINIPAGVYAIDPTTYVENVESWFYDIVARIGESNNKRTINPSLLPRTVARLTDISNKITAPTTAQVGQVIAVKAVDAHGRPTEWEAVDMGAGGGSVSEDTVFITVEDIDTICGTSISMASEVLF